MLEPEPELVVVVPPFAAAVPFASAVAELVSELPVVTTLPHSDSSYAEVADLEAVERPIAYPHKDADTTVPSVEAHFVRRRRFEDRVHRQLASALDTGGVVGDAAEQRAAGAMVVVEDGARPWPGGEGAGIAEAGIECEM